MKALHRIGSCATLAITAAVWSPGAAAQDAPTRAELDHMHDAAMEAAYEPGTGNLEQVAWQHGSVAYLRQSDDPRRYECLRVQAQLLLSIGEERGAVFHLEEAARQAAAQGARFDAAMSYVDAAVVAKGAGDVEAARRLGRYALDMVPVLDRRAGERDAVLDRLGMGW